MIQIKKVSSVKSEVSKEVKRSQYKEVYNVDGGRRRLNTKE